MEKIKELESDLRGICEKYDIKNAAFCGETLGEFIGIPVSDSGPVLSCFATVLNVGRMWQAMREQTRAMLDMFEQKRGW